MLIGELHGHTATERLTDHRRPGDAKFIEQITQPHRERTQRIVTARLLSVTNFGVCRTVTDVRCGIGSRRG